MRRIIVALAMIGIIGTANANPRPIPRPIPQRNHQTVIIHEHKTDVVPYVFAGIIAGVIIYHITQTKCDSGLACVKF